MKKIYLLILSTIIVHNLFGQFKVISSGEARLWTNNMGPWDNTMVTVVNNDYSKAYVVAKGCELCNHRYYVRGDGKVYSNGYYSISDSRKKENIDSIHQALDKLLLLNGVTYRLINDEVPTNHTENHNVFPDSVIFQDSEKIKPKKKEMGLIAQNVLQVVPEAVDTLEDGYLAISYDALVGLLIEAVKEQQVQIETLQKIVYSQEKEIIQLKGIVENCCENENKSKIKSASIEEGTTSIDKTKSENAKLFDNVPNPFSLNTEIKFEIPENSTSAKLIIHDMQGIELKSFNITQKGAGSITINGLEFNAGMYLYTLLIDNKIIDTKRMLLTKE